MINKIFPDREILEKFCQTNHITKMSLFGSVLKGCDTPQSDIDLLVEFDPNHIPGLLRFAGMQNQLSDMMGGRAVDLRTKGFLCRYTRDEVLAEAEPIYEAAKPTKRYDLRLFLSVAFLVFWFGNSVSAQESQNTVKDTASPVPLEKPLEKPSAAQDDHTEPRHKTNNFVMIACMGPFTLFGLAMMLLEDPKYDSWGGWRDAVAIPLAIIGLPTGVVWWFASGVVTGGYCWNL
ncbi:MAG: nucleotidyltransferase family protein [Candidatus Symbiobacter sp.]|nr:nucleotidyltransferase family protein [Candidatus Symbiobacter sp.]